MNYRVGFFRIWLAGSLVWLVWFLWRNDIVGCIFWDSGAPWCKYRDAEYNLFLLAKAVGIPLLVGLVVFISFWIVSGFASKNSN